MSLPLPRDAVILPSVMSADMLALGDQLTALTAAGARAFHVDVMDGAFVPNLTVGPDWTRAMARVAHAGGAVVDVHLMVARPGDMIPLFAPWADAISIHVEADPHPHRLLGAIRASGCHAGLALNPGTPVAQVAELGDDLDYVNVLAVDPGFAGQSFIASAPRRIARLRELLPDRVVIEVDGGIGPATLPAAREAGATMLVSASAIFGARDPLDAFRALTRSLAG